MAILKPEGVFVAQPRVAVLGYPGKRPRALHNPNGVVAARYGWGGDAIDLLPPVCPLWAATPLGLCGPSRSFPRVAEYSNPGLPDETPLG